MARTSLSLSSPLLPGAERPATIAAYYHPLAAIASHPCEESVERDDGRAAVLMVIALTISLTAALYTLAMGEGFVWAILSFFVWPLASVGGLIAAICGAWDDAFAILLPLFVGTIIGILISTLIELSVKRKNRQLEAQQAEQRAADAEKKKQLLAERAEQATEAECRSLATLLSKSQEIVFSLKGLIFDADKHLNKAEVEFSERAFAPFWDEVEHATNKLASYHQAVKEIERNAADYARRSSQLPLTIPTFEISRHSLIDALPVATRLSLIVRKAQKDFHFATIFEQRSTNQLLVAGFGTLASAIGQMQHSIHLALDDLSETLNIGLGALLSASNAQADLIGNFTDHVATNAKSQRRFENASLAESKKQSKMLDDIKRHRKPFP